jgi:GT2 family glycosyltransferase
VQLSIIIVNYNVKYFLELCLQSVLAATKNITTEIIVVDNNSSDNSKDYFTKYNNAVQFIWLNENVGFAKANNKALQLAQGVYTLFLNPDTIIAEDCLHICLQHFAQNNNTGCVGIKMSDATGTYLPESKRAFPSLRTSVCKLLGLHHLFPTSKWFANYYHGNLSANKNQKIDVVSGAFLMAKTAVLKKVGGFDERYFMYAEDIDLSFAVQQLGFDNYYLADTKMIHFKGESGVRGNLAFTKRFYNAILLFVKKHYTGFYGTLLSTFLQAAILAAAAVHFFAFTIKKFFGEKVPTQLLVFTDKTIPINSALRATKEVDKATAFVLNGSKISFKKLIQAIIEKGKRCVISNEAETVFFIGVAKNSNTMVIDNIK